MKKLLTISILLCSILGYSQKQVKIFVYSNSQNYIGSVIEDSITGEQVGSKAIWIRDLNESQTLIVNNAMLVCQSVADSTLFKDTIGVFKTVTYVRETNSATIQSFTGAWYSFELKEFEITNPIDKMKIDLLGYLCLIYNN